MAKNKKFYEADRRIFAYRITTEDGIREVFEDDNEVGAGEKLMGLL